MAGGAATVHGEFPCRRNGMHWAHEPGQEPQVCGGLVASFVASFVGRPDSGSTKLAPKLTTRVTRPPNRELAPFVASLVGRFGDRHFRRRRGFDKAYDKAHDKDFRGRAQPVHGKRPQPRGVSQVLIEQNLKLLRALHRDVQPPLIRADSGIESS